MPSVLQDVAVDEYLILGGDFNCTESNLDRNHMEPHLPSRQRLVQIKKTHELIDIWRQLDGEQRQYTWSHVRDNMISLARLDTFYVLNIMVVLLRVVLLHHHVFQIIVWCSAVSF